MPITGSPEETKEIAENLAKSLSEPTCISLTGSLGAGKTVFVKGLAKGLGIEDVIKSPTFVLMRSYSGRMKLHHIDLYRIEVNEEFLPFEEFLLNDGVCAIEWADKVENFLPESKIEVRIKILSKSNRKVTIDDNRN